MKTIEIIMILIAIMTLIICGIILYKVIIHYEMFANDPLVYGAKQWDINSCSCTTNQGDTLDFNQERVHKVVIRGIPSSKQIDIKNVNFSKIIPN